MDDTQYTDGDGHIRLISYSGADFDAIARSKSPLARAQHSTRAPVPVNGPFLLLGFRKKM
jgi:hypothetical protein